MNKSSSLRRAATAAGAVALSLAAYAGLGASELAMSPQSAASARPVWDGQGAYTSGVQPHCPARDAGHLAVIGTGPAALTARCDADGPVYVWDVLAGCVIPGTRTSVPSGEGARFDGPAHSCVNSAWVPFSPAENAR